MLPFLSILLFSFSCCLSFLSSGYYFVSVFTAFVAYFIFSLVSVVSVSSVFFVFCFFNVFLPDAYSVFFAFCICSVPTVSSIFSDICSLYSLRFLFNLISLPTSQPVSSLLCFVCLLSSPVFPCQIQSSTQANSGGFCSFALYVASDFFFNSIHFVFTFISISSVVFCYVSLFCLS